MWRLVAAVCAAYLGLAFLVSAFYLFVLSRYWAWREGEAERRRLEAHAARELRGIGGQGSRVVSYGGRDGSGPKGW